MKSKKGFTLIELLAIIVILAIIAVITVPIILNIIDNSRKGAATDSAYGYKSAIQNFYVSKLSEDSNYNLPNKVLSTSVLKNMGVSLDGEEPGANSWVLIKNNNISSACLQFNDYSVNFKDGSIDNTSKSECENYYDSIDFGGKYLTDAGDLSDSGLLGIVYLDPTNLANTCDENSTLVTNDGCMRWYVYSKDSSTNEVTMILDHNTSNDIPWISESDWNNPPTNLGISYPAGTSFSSDVYNVSKNNNTINGNNKKGPLTLLSQLLNDTKNWDLPAPSYVYSPSDNSYSDYEIDFSNYNARLISAEEIAQIIEKSSWTISSGAVFFEGESPNNQRGQGGSNYSWLFDNLNNCIGFGCNTDSNTNGSAGYWLVSPYIGENPNMNWTYAGWTVNFLGYLNNVNSYDSENGFGVRPVITLPESILLNN